MFRNNNSISISSSSVISNQIWKANNPPRRLNNSNKKYFNNQNNNQPIRYKYQYQNQVDRYSFPSITKFISQSNESIYVSNNAKRRRRREIVFHERQRKKNFQIVESRSINGFRKIYTYYIDGVKCDGFGRVSTDPGFQGYPNNPTYTQPPIPIIKSKKNLKWKKIGIWGLDSGTELQIKKQNNQYLYIQDLLNLREKYLNNINHITIKIVDSIENFFKININDVTDLETFSNWSSFLLLKNRDFNQVFKLIFSIVTSVIYPNRSISNLIVYPPPLINFVLPLNYLSPPSYFKLATLNNIYSKNHTMSFPVSYNRPLSRLDQSYNNYIPLQKSINNANLFLGDRRLIKSVGYFNGEVLYPNKK